MLHYFDGDVPQCRMWSELSKSKRRSLQISLSGEALQVDAS